MSRARRRARTPARGFRMAPGSKLAPQSQQIRAVALVRERPVRTPPQLGQLESGIWLASLSGRRLPAAPILAPDPVGSPPGVFREATETARSIQRAVHFA